MLWRIRTTRANDLEIGDGNSWLHLNGNGLGVQG
jgi:hypothetical protein